MSLQIAILGMLWEREGHPYEIKKRMQQFDLDHVISITDGALYYNFEALVKKEFLQKIEVVHSDNRPDKKMYAITEKGRQGLKDEIYSKFKKSTDIKSLSGSIPFIHLVDRDRLSFLIEDIIEKLQKKLDLIHKHRTLYPELLVREPIIFLADFSEHGARNEKEWFEKLLGIVKKM